MAVAALAPGGCGSTPFPSTAATASSQATLAPADTPAPEAAAVLERALAGLQTASEFETTVTLDGELVTSLSGRTVGEATSLVARTGDRTVEYLRIPPTAWAREPGANWLVVNAEQAPQSPLATLAVPTSLRFAPGSTSVLEAIYPAAALGLEGTDAPVTITLEPDAVTFRYEQASSGRSVVSMTIVRPAADTSPIPPPSPGP